MRTQSSVWTWAGAAPEASVKGEALLRELSPGRTKAKGPQVQRPWSPALLALHAPPLAPSASSLHLRQAVPQSRTQGR